MDGYTQTRKHPHTEKHSDTRAARSYRHAQEHHGAGLRSPFGCSYTEARHPIPRPTRLPSGSASAQPGRPSLRGRLPPLLLSLLHLRLKTYKTLLRINPGSRLLPPRPAAVAPPFIFARRRVSPSPRVARPPLLPARRPRRTWTSLSIRSPPRSRSPRLRTDLARGGGGKRRRTND